MDTILFLSTAIFISHGYTNSVVPCEHESVRCHVNVAFVLQNSSIASVGYRKTI